MTTAAAKNQARFPELAAFVSELRAGGCEPKVTYAHNKETGDTIGSPAPEEPLSLNADQWLHLGTYMHPADIAKTEPPKPKSAGDKRRAQTKYKTEELI